jgi:hypothetical protein
VPPPNIPQWLYPTAIVRRNPNQPPEFQGFSYLVTAYWVEAVEHYPNEPTTVRFRNVLQEDPLLVAGTPIRMTLPEFLNIVDLLQVEHYQSDPQVRPSNQYPFQPSDTVNLTGPSGQSSDWRVVTTVVQYPGMRNFLHLEGLSPLAAGTNVDQGAPPRVDVIAVPRIPEDHNDMVGWYAVVSIGVRPTTQPPLFVARISRVRFVGDEGTTVITFQNLSARGQNDRHYSCNMEVFTNNLVCWLNQENLYALRMRPYINAPSNMYRFLGIVLGAINLQRHDTLEAESVPFNNFVDRFDGWMVRDEEPPLTEFDVVPPEDMLQVHDISVVQEPTDPLTRFQVAGFQRVVNPHVGRILDVHPTPTNQALDDTFPLGCRVRMNREGGEIADGVITQVLHGEHTSVIAVTFDERRDKVIYPVDSFNQDFIQWHVGIVTPRIHRAGTNFDADPEAQRILDGLEALLSRPAPTAWERLNSDEGD